MKKAVREAIGTPSRVRGGSAGAALITDYSDSVGTAALLHRILTDDSQRPEMIQRGPARAKAFDFDILTRGSLDALRSVLQRLEIAADS